MSAAAYDAIIVGAGTAGIPCAIAAAERGCVVAGLHAIGEALGAASLMGNTILGGMMITSALSFGRLLGRRLAEVCTA